MASGHRSSQTLQGGDTGGPWSGTFQINQKQEHAGVKMSTNVLEQLGIKFFGEMPFNTSSFFFKNSPHVWVIRMWPLQEWVTQSTRLLSLRPCKGPQWSELRGCLQERLPVWEGTHSREHDCADGAVGSPIAQWLPGKAPVAAKRPGHRRGHL